MARVGEAYVDIKANLDGFEKAVERGIDDALKGAQSGVRSFTDGISTTLRETGASVQQVGTNVSRVGTNLTKSVTLPIVGMGTAVLMASGNFEASMNKVRAITGATGGDIDALRNQAKELGSSTMFSASQAADAMTFLGMAGFDATQILSAMPSVLELAAAANIDLASAADITSNIMSGYGMTTEQLTGANDALVATLTKSNTDLTMLGDAFKYVAPVAKGAGVEFDQAAAALGLLGNAGIQGSMAGTSLRGIISALIKPTGGAKDALEALGINALDSAGNLLPLDQIIQQLEESGASTADMMTIFGQRAGPAMMALVEQGSEALRELTQELENSGGTAERIATIQMEGFKGGMTEFKSAMEGLMIAIGESGLLESMERFIRQVTGIVQGLSQTNPALLKTITVVLGIAAAVGPVVFIIGKLILIVGKLITAIGLLFTPVGLVVAAIAAVVAVVVLVIKNFERIRGVVTQVGNAFSGFAKSVGDVFRRIGGVISSAFGSISRTFESFLGFVTGIWNSITGAATSAFDAVADAFRSVVDVLSGILSGFKSFFVGVFDAIVSYLEIVFRVWEVMFAVVLGIWVIIIEHFYNRVKAIWDAISDYVFFVLDVIVAIFRRAIDRVVDTLNTFKEIFLSVWEFIRGAFSAVMDVIVDIWDMAFGAIKGVLDTFAGIFRTVWRALSEAFKVIVDAITSAWSAAMGLLRSIVEPIVGAITKAFETFWGVVSGIFSSIESTGRTIFGALRDFAVGAFDAIVGGIKSAVNGVLSGIESGLNFGVRAINTLIRSANRVPGVNISEVGGVTLPRLANGAIINRATIAQIGEAGPEAVIPISRPGRAMQLMEQSGLADMVRQSGSAVTIQNANFVNGTDADLVAQKVLAAWRGRTAA